MVKTILFGLIGGLGMFLFGMRLMSEGLRKVADRRLRQILELLTKKPVIGLLVGAGVTCLIQSSSATTVMTVGLVNAALLTLRQAIGVILGANIGTTVTAWLVSFFAVFKITNYALPAIGIGFAINTLARRRSTRLWGQVLMGFGILFMGIHFMKDAFSPLKESETVKNVFVQFSQHPLLGVLVGTIVTMMLQSSSATIAMVQVLAFQGLISFDAAIPLILGDNIGTTITAQIAAAGTNRNARRAAMAHTLFNVIGVAYMLIFVYLGWYSRAVNYLVGGNTSAQTIMLRIAIAHSVFNVFNAVVVFLPMIGLLEKTARLLVPGEDAPDGEPKFLEEHLLDTPPVALAQATKELVRMAKMAREAVNEALEGFFNNDRKRLEAVSSKEEAVDCLQIEITRYLVALSTRTLSEVLSQELPVLLHSVNDIERVSDHAENIVELAERKMEQNLPFTELAIKELRTMCGHVNEMMENVLKALEKNDQELARRALKTEEILNTLQLEFRRTHGERLEKGQCKLLSGLVFLDMVDNLEKIGDHLTNVAQAIIGGLKWDGVRAKMEPADQTS